MATTINLDTLNGTLLDSQTERMFHFRQSSSFGKVSQFINVTSHTFTKPEIYLEMGLFKHKSAPILIKLKTLTN